MLIDTRTFRGANVDSDHNLVIAVIRACIIKHNFNKTLVQRIEKYNVEELQVKPKREEFRRRMEDRLKIK